MSHQSENETHKEPSLQEDLDEPDRKINYHSPDQKKNERKELKAQTLSLGKNIKFSESKNPSISETFSLKRDFFSKIKQTSIYKKDDYRPVKKFDMKLPFRKNKTLINNNFKPESAQRIMANNSKKYFFKKSNNEIASSLQSKRNFISKTIYGENSDDKETDSRKLLYNSEFFQTAQTRCQNNFKLLPGQRYRNKMFNSLSMNFSNQKSPSLQNISSNFNYFFPKTNYDPSEYYMIKLKRQGVFIFLSMLGKLMLSKRQAYRYSFFMCLLRKMSKKVISDKKVISHYDTTKSNFTFYKLRHFQEIFHFG